MYEMKIQVRYSEVDQSWSSKTPSDFRIFSGLWNVSVRGVRTWSRRRSEES